MPTDSELRVEGVAFRGAGGRERGTERERERERARAHATLQLVGQYPESGNALVAAGAVSLRAPYDTSSGRDCVKSLRL